MKSEIICALKAYSREVRKKMSLQTKSSILWTYFLQARKFSQGEVSVLCKFTTMHAGLQSTILQVIHSEVPAELTENYFANDIADKKEKDREPNEPKRKK